MANSYLRANRTLADIKAAHRQVRLAMLSPVEDPEVYALLAQALMALAKGEEMVWDNIKATVPEGEALTLVNKALGMCRDCLASAMVAGPEE